MKVLPRTYIGNPILRSKAKKVSLRFLKTSKAKNLIKKMVYTMHKDNGVGLAAPQINQPIQIVVMEMGSAKDKKKHKGPIVAVNPKITHYSKEKVIDWEGCLSFRGFCAKVPRSKHITVTYFNADGEKIKESASGFWARIFQHEIDHLNGIIYIDRVEDTKTIMSRSEFKKRIAGKKKKIKKVNRNKK